MRRAFEFNALGVIETPLVSAIEVAIANSQTFRVLIGQSKNEPLSCARDIARDVAKIVELKRVANG